jgi:hypothetical protein
MSVVELALIGSRRAVDAVASTVESRWYETCEENV